MVLLHAYKHIHGKQVRKNAQNFLASVLLLAGGVTVEGDKEDEEGEENEPNMP